METELYSRVKFCEIFYVTDDEDRLDDTADVLCLYKHTALPYSIYVEFKRREKKREPTDGEEVKQYAGFVGGKCARRMLLYRC